MTTNMTGISIRKALLKAGINPNKIDEGALYQMVADNSIDEWEFEGQVLLGNDGEGAKVIDRFRI